ncbi:hypothetical protein EYB45_08865 [Erythrobacteraceae bacterium CFH 75059]|uniref:Ig-like domain-containing protein n=1 Tax=Qipengyuania thermophila TaxID=2509361 RepID=UPI00102176C0|nr:hypothetical protein [Qipengyuania thermophila]TCD04338.1 hypothetical protein EYB45_08865 [Erythrobacteraceae bacterium CFH 75059]
MRMHLFAAAACASIVVPTGAASQQVIIYGYDALGRLTSSQGQGGQVQNDTRSWCYDQNGNRLHVRAEISGTPVICQVPPNVAPPSPPPPSPPPPPPAPPGNTPPVTQLDQFAGECNASATINVTANDYDAEDAPNLPTLVSISSNGDGGATAHVVSSSAVVAYLGPAGDLTSFTYVVQDTASATATGTLIVHSMSCGGMVDPM